jgi:hypothetical protein
LAAPVDVGAHGLIQLGADGGDPLGKFGGGDAVGGQALLIKALQLPKLVGLEALEIAVNRFDGSYLVNAISSFSRIIGG